MLLTSIPARITLPFANGGTKNTIPVPSQIGITAGAASFTDGFPPLTMTPVGSGGVPPYGADFNGILNAITAIQRWQSGGGMFQYDSAWSSANGGYPKGAVLLKGTGTGYWVCTADNNTTNPDTGGANWSDLGAVLDLSANPQFGSFLGASGYQKLPSGLILQWGSSTTNVSGVASITFPITFPTLCTSVLAMDMENVAANICYAGVAWANSSATLTFAKGGVATNAANITWQAVGY